MASDRVSAHIVTCNRPAELYGLLVSLRNQTLTEWDLVLVDDSDRPVTANKAVFDIVSRIRMEGHMVKYVKNPFPTRNIGVNRNIAIESCPNRIGCRIDDDSVLEPDYLERLLALLTSEKGAGAVGGIVPPLGHPRIERVPPAVFNRVTVTESGITISDDGGYCYRPDAVIKSHHLRSSFMYWNGAVRKAGMHPTEYSSTGWREETDLCIRLIMAGYGLFTDTAAICWHAQAPSGGGRSLPLQDRVRLQGMLEDHFQRKFMRYIRAGRLDAGVFEC